MFCSHGIFASVSGKQTLVTSFSQRNVCCRICLEQNLFGDSSPNSSASLPTFSIVCLFDSTHPSGRRVVSHCGFHLLSIFFSYAYWPFYIFTLPLAEVAVLQWEIDSFALSKWKYISLVVLKLGNFGP